MIIVRLNGGLGNQMFQYAAALALSKERGDKLKIDNTELLVPKERNQAPRIFSLNEFKISAQTASSAEITSIKYRWGLLSSLNRLIQKKFLRKYYVDWHPEIKKMTGNIYLDGYFQAENYFLNHCEDILSEFVLDEESEKELDLILGGLKNVKPLVTLHVRRGDYVSNARVNKTHNICGDKYFYDALEYFKQKLPEFNVIVFSDDVNWVKSNLELPGNPFYVSDEANKLGIHLDEAKELVLMSRCDHHIISNSSYSWWGAYLNRSKSKIVVAPSIWSKGSIPQPNIIPANWIRLPIE